MSFPFDAPPPPPPRSLRRRTRRRVRWSLAGVGAAALLVVTVAQVPGNPADAIAGSPPGATTSTGPAATEPSAAPTSSPTAAVSVTPGLPIPETDATETVTGLSLTRLAEIPTKGRAPRTGYDRELFGQAWSDDVEVAGGHNGCDTRNDILRRDLTAVQLKPGSNDCAVLSGTLTDPYTGRSLSFVRGASTSSAVQIDHVVALSDAWQKGAQGWDEITRRNFANDPRNLLAVDGPTNQRKGAGDAATWLPPDRSYWCSYVIRQVEVKAAYGLWMTVAEHDRIGVILTDNCGGAA